jgi:hypothetical protein
MREELKLSSDVGDSDIKKCRHGFGWVWRSLRLAEVFSRHQYISAFNLVYKNMLKILYFLLICEDNAGINYRSVQHEKGIAGIKAGARLRARVRCWETVRMYV